MTPKPGTQRLVIFVAIPLALTVALGVSYFRRKKSTGAGTSETKAAIFQFLSKQTGQKDFTPPFDFELPAQTATLRSIVYPLEQRMASLRERQRSLDGEMEPLRKEVEAVRAGTLRLKQDAAATKVALKEAESRPQPDREEIARLQAEVESKSRAWILKREEIDPKETQLRAKTGERAMAIDRELRDVDTMLQPIRDELRTKEHELSGQENVFIRAVRAGMAETHSYETMYVLIGQQLRAADRLLTETDKERRRMGVNFAKEACGHALSEAQSPWLAARICEVYLWPHLDLADYRPDTKERAQDILRLGKAAFSDADETKSLERNFELMIAHAPDRRYADSSRLDFAELLEQTGEFQRAQQCLNEVQEPEVLAAAQQRLARIKARLPAMK